MQPDWHQSTATIPSARAGVFPRRLLTLAMLASLYPSPSPANPTGGQAVHGQVSIDNSVPGVTTVTNSPGAIIQWQNFNIAEHELTRFLQQNSQSAVLNRIIGGDPSTILGQLISNGKVLLINPNGVVFGANATVDTQGLLVSSLNLSNEDFLKGNYHFIAGGNAGAIVNQGIIRAGKDGNIVLIAPSIHNSGVIKSEGGQLILAAGQELVLTSLDNPSIRYQVKAPDNNVLNLGKLLSAGGAINVFAGSISHSGEINADSVSVDAQGTIKLVAEQSINLAAGSRTSADNRNGNAGAITVASQQGATVVAGSVSARAERQGQGGSVAILGKQVGLVGAAKANADGADGGGQILVGGDAHGGNPAIANAEVTYLGKGTELSANALRQGHGGKVVAWADNTTRAYGQINAQGGRQGGDGGWVETSARHLDTNGLNVNASAPKGHSGQWLLDPNNVVIANQGQDVHVTAKPNFVTTDDNAVVSKQSIESALNNGTSVNIATGTAGANHQQGNITVAAAIAKSAGDDATLRLTAHNNITINAPITATSGKLDLKLRPDSDQQHGGGSYINKALALNSGTLTLFGKSLLAGTTGIHNANLYFPNHSKAVFDGGLGEIDNVTVAKNATVAINRNSNFNSLTIEGGKLTGDGAIHVAEEFEFAHGQLAGDGRLVTEPGSKTQLATAGDAYLDKNWLNAGTVYWQDSGALKQQTSAPVSLTNASTGVINIGTPGQTAARQLGMATFSNNGKVNVTGGSLAILGGGADTGSYQVGASGKLSFTGNAKVFNGAAITSDNPVSFNNGEYRWVNHAVYSAPATVVNNGLLAFSTGASVNLPKLTLKNASLTGADNIAITEQFNFHSGTIAGGGGLTTTKNASTTLADAGSVYLNRKWQNQGTVNWAGQAAIGDSSGAFINKPSGVFNVSGAGANDVLGIHIGRFDNQGVVNITDARLQLASYGTDSGRYHVNPTGRLEFLDHTRGFDNGAVITSSNPVRFQGGKNFFHEGARYQAQDAIIDNAQVAFNTGNALTLNALTLTNSARLTGADAINILSRFNFYSGLATGPGELYTQADARTRLYDSTALVNKTWNNHGRVDFAAPPVGTPRPDLPDTPLAIKQWNNYGVINWTGPTLPANPLAKLVVLNNQASGVFNVNNSDSASFRELNVAAFNNQGVTNVQGGGLKISGGGADSGHYHVADNGHLQFADGKRVFLNGSQIDGNNPVIFSGGLANFAPGSNYRATNTLIDGATVNFTNTALNNLDLTSGALNANQGLTVNGVFNWSGGSLAGAGALNFTQRFNYSGGVMAATGTVTIQDHGGDLRLPAMPAITRLAAQTLGNLRLTGNINASGGGDAIQLLAGNKFDNSQSAALTAANGRWLVYANRPDAGKLGGLSADFKHYGCRFASGCNDGFSVPAASGNGLLYGITPVLTVTPNTVTSSYGDAVNFTAHYRGFIDGDTAASITGTARFALGGPVSGSGRYAAGTHEVAYQGGLNNILGYRIRDDRASLQEWTVTPRSLLIRANAQEKLAGEQDPALTYTAKGLLSGDQLTGALIRKPGESVGDYPIRRGTLSAGSNYAIKYRGEEFEIKHANGHNEKDHIENEIGNQQNSQLALSQQLDVIDEIEHNDSHREGTGLTHVSEQEPRPGAGKTKKLQQCR